MAGDRGEWNVCQAIFETFFDVVSFQWPCKRFVNYSNKIQFLNDCICFFDNNVFNCFCLKTFKHYLFFFTHTRTNGIITQHHWTATRKWSKNACTQFSEYIRADPALSLKRPPKKYHIIYLLICISHKIWMCMRCFLQFQ